MIVNCDKKNCEGKAGMCQKWHYPCSKALAWNPPFQCVHKDHLLGTLKPPYHEAAWMKDQEEREKRLAIPAEPAPSQPSS